MFKFIPAKVKFNAELVLSDFDYLVAYFPAFLEIAKGIAAPELKINQNFDLEQDSGHSARWIEIMDETEGNINENLDDTRVTLIDVLKWTDDNIPYATFLVTVEHLGDEEEETGTRTVLATETFNIFSIEYKPKLMLDVVDLHEYITTALRIDSSRASFFNEVGDLAIMFKAGQITRAHLNKQADALSVKYRHLYNDKDWQCRLLRDYFEITPRISFEFDRIDVSYTLFDRKNMMYVYRAERSYPLSKAAK